MITSFTQRPTGTEIAKRAWNSTISGIRAMPALFLAAFFVAILLSLALLFARPDRAAGFDHFPTLRMLGVTIVSILVWSALAAPVAVAIHRYVLLDQVTGSVLSFAPRHTKLFFLWAIALRLAYSAAQDATGLLYSHYFAVFRFVAIIAVAIVSVHMAMIFPAVAIEDGADDWRVRITRSWRQMQGSCWLLIRAGIVAFLPVIVVWAGMTIVMVLFGFMARSVIGSADTFSVLPRLWLSAVIAMLAVLSIALGAALASWTYAWTRNNDQAQSAQTATSTVT